MAAHVVSVSTGAVVVREILVVSLTTVVVIELMSLLLLRKPVLIVVAVCSIHLSVVVNKRCGKSPRLQQQ
jgi:hypothetical protein